MKKPKVQRLPKQIKTAADTNMFFISNFAEKNSVASLVYNVES